MKSFRSRQIHGKLGARFAIVKTRGLVPANVITVEELNVVSDTDRPLPLLGSLPAKEPREGRKKEGSFSSSLISYAFALSF